MWTHVLQGIAPALSLHRWLRVVVLCLLFFAFITPAIQASRSENLPLTGDIPSPRSDHSMVRIGDQYFIYGGRGADTDVKSITDTGPVYDDLYVYTPFGNHCQKVTPLGTPPPKLFGHTAFVYKEQMYVFSGHKVSSEGTTSNGASNELWKYDPATNQWLKLVTNGPTPPARVYSAGVNSVTRIWVSGGVTSVSSTSSLNDSWVYDPETSTWVQKGNIPQAGRYGHGMVQDGTGNVYILGGRNEYGVQYYGWKYDPRTNTWIESLPDNAPPPVSNSIVICPFTGKVYFRIGGYGYSSNFSKSTNKNEWEKIIGEVWKLDLLTMKWEQLGNVEPVAYGAGAFYDDPEDPDDEPKPIVFGGLDEDENPVNNMTLLDPGVEPPASSVDRESLHRYE